MSPLAKALPAMTLLQATVALGTFLLSVLAPLLGLSVTRLAALSTLMFGVGTLAAGQSGRWLARWGDWRVAAACATAVALGMACLRSGIAAAPWVAVLLLGLAFGPETPASASVLTRVTAPARRPWIFSVRQTGNQLGAMAGSLMLPVLLARSAGLPYLVVGGFAVAMAIWCVVLSRDETLAPAASEPPSATSVTAVISVKGTVPGALKRVCRSRPLALLAIATFCYTALQMCLNTFLMTLAVREWQVDVTRAAVAVGLLQAAGLGGRLFWGWVAQRAPDARRLLGGIGLAMAASDVALMSGASQPFGAGSLACLLVLGFTASGWNGVLVAEVSRRASPSDAGAITGAVLMFGYAGLTLAPLGFAALSVACSMAWAFTALAAGAGAAGALLLAGSGARDGVTA